jgi:hypothetical protein
MDYCSWSKCDYKISWNYDSEKIKEEQILEIDTLEDSLEITFKEILFNCKDSTDKVLKFLECSEKDSIKVKSYLKRFKLDVDDEFRGEV